MTYPNLKSVRLWTVKAKAIIPRALSTWKVSPISDLSLTSSYDTTGILLLATDTTQLNVNIRRLWGLRSMKHPVNNLDAACNVKKKKEKNISTLIRRWWSLQHTCHYRDTWLTSMQTTFQSCYPISTANVSAYIYTCVQVLRPNLSPNYNLWLSIYKSIF